MLKFTKMHGCGNDYIYIDGARERIPAEQKPEIVRRLSDRHFGIGGDGVIFINPSDQADFEMEMYNMDGTRAEMCGNGIRCVAKYVYDKGQTDQTKISVISAGKIRKKKEKVLDLDIEMRKGHMDRVSKGKCATEMTGPLNDILHAIDRMGNCCVNIADAALDKVDLNYFNATNSPEELTVKE